MDMHLAPHQWLPLPKEIKAELIRVFDIPRTGWNDVVVDGLKAAIKHDGYTYENLSAISREKMQEFTGSTEVQYFTLFDLTVKKIIAQVVGPTEKKKGGRPKKQAEVVHSLT